jgi:hypothetical protein
VLNLCVTYFADECYGCVYDDDDVLNISVHWSSGVCGGIVG